MGTVNTFTKGLVRILELNRPEKRNALNDELIGDLKAALSDAHESGDVHAVILRGAGSDFCSGADLASLKAISENSRDENVADARRLAQLYEQIRKTRVPVVAAVHGRALAGGCGLATACDMVIAAESATFGYPEVKIGFVPAMVSAILRRNVGEKRAFELLTRGVEYSAADALSMGLVNKVVPDVDLGAEALEFAAAYEHLSQSAVEMTKRLLYDIDGLDLSDAMNLGAEVNADARMTEDYKAGIAKFLKKD